MAEYYVYKSPTDGHCAVARSGEGGTIGWQQLHGADTFDGCWAWIRSNCSGGPNYFKC